MKQDNNRPRSGSVSY